MHSTAAIGGTFSEKLIDDHLAVQAIIRSYQVFYYNLYRYFFLDFILLYNILFGTYLSFIITIYNPNHKLVFILNK